jgi:hypothetical protein
LWVDHKDNAFGLLQAVDSFNRWDSQLRGIDREEKVARGVLSGSFDQDFAKAEELLNKVLVTV